jgi:hypothetical protein
MAKIKDFAKTQKTKTKENQKAKKKEIVNQKTKEKEKTRQKTIQIRGYMT